VVLGASETMREKAAMSAVASADGAGFFILSRSNRYPTVENRNAPSITAVTSIRPVRRRSLSKSSVIPQILSRNHSVRDEAMRQLLISPKKSVT
jgi:hypothetical protein